MTPKEKANKLCMRFLIQTTTDIPYGINKTIAKECALIAADEVINTIMSVYQPETKAFWFEVKQEIESL
jgi:ABC-type cobalt transport system substrate-binding protein